MTQPRLKRLTYGVLPPLAEFQRHVDKGVDEDGESLAGPSGAVYTMELASDEEQQWAIDILDLNHDIAHTIGTGKYGKMRVVISDVPSLHEFIRGTPTAKSRSDGPTPARDHPR